ncbi:hypothetical protein TNCV_375281 [Trichonephila clavipes]|nr:hypothetical protein TNCV_375281 [Trichonephila clavipes]
MLTPQKECHPYNYHYKSHVLRQNLFGDRCSFEPQSNGISRPSGIVVSDADCGALGSGFESQASFTASAHTENEGVNELLMQCCPFVLQRHRSSRIVTGGKVRASKRLLRKSHSCSMGLRSEIMPANSYVQYPHSIRAFRQLLCDDNVHCRP